MCVFVCIYIVVLRSVVKRLHSGTNSFSRIFKIKKFATQINKKCMGVYVFAFVFMRVCREVVQNEEYKS